MRLIDADALKDKLQQHHDFYVMAWGGFGKMPIGEKKRVDEITSCIAEVVNAPTIEPKRGEWIEPKNEVAIRLNQWICSECNYLIDGKHNFCPNCGADMRNCSEKPNNCEPQTYVINPQEPTNDEKCFECDDFFTCGGQCNKIEDEPQRDCFLCKWLGEVDVCGRCRNRNLFAEADTEPKPKDEPHAEIPEYAEWKEPFEKMTDCPWK